MNSINNLNHLIPDFLHIANRYCNNNWSVPIATRNFHNLLFVVSGEGISYSKGKEYKLSSGMLIYHSPGETYGYSTSQSNPMHCYGINFHVLEAMFSGGKWITNNVEQLPYNNKSSIPSKGILNKYFEDLSTVWEEGGNNNLLKCRSIFLNILYELYTQLLLEDNIDNTIKKIKDVIVYIRKNYKSQITLGYLASLIDLNPKYFGSLFKKHTGYTPIDYLTKVRIEKAKEYLGIGYSVSETSVLVGYNDPFYFSKVFKKTTGIAPREYAKKPLHFC
ncbi:AraC family transcriptional regulator [Vallitalea guaymasensis]|uniref:AraC family transcriptional regulator n=1 Tax=Vallitalea guaymasensis TaxID=1185412 RepID=UPI00272D18F3|nr:helix-turn-helix domain-containing protein [Vallitalea guaymasensis]